MTTAAFPARTAMSNVVVASEDLLHRVRGEYLEMPGLRLTPAQAARLWGLHFDLSSAVLAVLVEAGFLMRARDGRYARRGDSERAGPI